MKLGIQTQQLQQLIQTFPDPSQFSLEEISKHYQLFVDVITDHNHRYYVDAQPIISDLEYDQLFDYLKKIEDYFPSLISSVSPTQALLAQLPEGFQKANHRVPLLSLENSYNAADLLARGERIHKLIQKSDFSLPRFLVEPKFDGISVELIYRQGKFIQAITRGDGMIGEDITKNVRQISTLPLSIDYLEPLHLKAEIMLAKSQLAQINTERIMRGESEFANTRNAAAGTIKLLDPQEVKKRKLSIFVYEILYTNTAIDLDLKALGFPVIELPPEFAFVETIEQVVATCLSQTLQAFLYQQDVSFDGLVIKLEDQLLEKQSLRHFLGSTQHHPRWAIAYKYPAEQIVTQILSLDFQVGRTGIITPVANLAPVELSGAKISRVSLHNFDFILKKDIRVGDFVWIQRSGEVIPYILASLVDRRDGTEEIISAPLMCPSCMAPIHNIDIHYYCHNPACPAQIKEKIIHFVSREMMDIGGIGEQLISHLVENKTLQRVDDLYFFQTIEGKILLRKFPLFAEKKIEELEKQLQASKEQPLWRLLHALGIPLVGKKLAQDLAGYFAQKQTKALSDLLEAVMDRSALAQIHGIGEKVLDSLALFFQSPETRELLTSLEQKGLNFDAQKYQILNLGGKHFSLTGSFPLGREQIVVMLENQGYLFDSNPNSKTDYLLIGEKAGSKAQKARDLGIQCIEGWEAVQEFFNLSLATESITPSVNSTEIPAQDRLF